MSFQVVRIEKFKLGSLKNIGNELERANGVEHRNSDIDVSLRDLNHVFKYSETGFYKRFYEILENLNCTFTGKSSQVSFEGMIITSDKAFFESLGWEKGKPAPQKVELFFERAYSWAVSKIGYKNTDKNIIGAQVHYDETTPHLQLYYIPVVDRWKEKVYEKDENGKVKKSEKGSPIQARDENGKALYKNVVSLDAPKVARTEFWDQRGGKTSYRQMQDAFYSVFHDNYKYDLERGEIGSDRKHKTKNQWENEQLKNERDALEKQIRTVTEQVNYWQAEHDRTKAEAEKLSDQIDKAREVLIDAQNTPSLPTIPPFVEWCEDHPLEMYRRKKLFKEPKDVLEQRRIDAYKVECGQISSAAAEWDSKWGVVAAAQNAIQQKEQADKRIKQLEEYNEYLKAQYNKLLKKSDKFRKESTDKLKELEIKHKKELETKSMEIRQLNGYIDKLEKELYSEEPSKDEYTELR